MTGKEILDANPKAASLIHDYYLNKLLDSLEDDNLPPEFKEFAREKGLPVENIVAMLEANPRNLFDVFDEQQIIISITYDRGSNKFCYFVNESKHEEQFDTRKKADESAVKTAISVLENKLNSLEKTNEDS